MAWNLAVYRAPVLPHLHTRPEIYKNLDVTAAQAS